MWVILPVLQTDKKDEVGSNAILLRHPSLLETQSLKQIEEQLADPGLNLVNVPRQNVRPALVVTTDRVLVLIQESSRFLRHPVICSVVVSNVDQSPTAEDRARVQALIRAYRDDLGQLHINPGTNAREVFNGIAGGIRAWITDQDVVRRDAPVGDALKQISPAPAGEIQPTIGSTSAKHFLLGSIRKTLQVGAAFTALALPGHLKHPAPPGPLPVGMATVRGSAPKEVLRIVASLEDDDLNQRVGARLVQLRQNYGGSLPAVGAIALHEVKATRRELEALDAVGPTSGKASRLAQIERLIGCEKRIIARVSAEPHNRTEWNWADLWWAFESDQLRGTNEVVLVRPNDFATLDDRVIRFCLMSVAVEQDRSFPSAVRFSGSRSENGRWPSWSIKVAGDFLDDQGEALYPLTEFQPTRRADVVTCVEYFTRCERLLDNLSSDLDRVIALRNLLRSPPSEIDGARFGSVYGRLVAQFVERCESLHVTGLAEDRFSIASSLLKKALRRTDRRHPDFSDKTDTALARLLFTTELGTAIFTGDTRRWQEAINLTETALSAKTRSEIFHDRFVFVTAFALMNPQNPEAARLVKDLRREFDSDGRRKPNSPTMAYGDLLTAVSMCLEGNRPGAAAALEKAETRNISSLFLGLGDAALFLECLRAYVSGKPNEQKFERAWREAHQYLSVSQDWRSPFRVLIGTSRGDRRGIGALISGREDLKALATRANQLPKR